MTTTPNQGHTEGSMAAEVLIKALLGLLVKPEISSLERRVLAEAVRRILFLDESR